MPRSPVHVPITRALVVSLLLSLVSVVAFAQVYNVPETDQPSAKAVRSQIEAPAASDVRVQVFIDPVTGRIRQPEPGEAAALAREASTKVAAKAPMRITQTSTGLLMAELDESFMDFLVLQIAQDGSLHSACVQGSESVSSIMRKPVVPATATKWEEK